MSNLKVRQMNNLRSRQLNPCDELYWKSRGFPERPYDWKERVYGENDADSLEDDESEYDADEYEENYYEDEDEEDDSEDYDEAEEYNYECTLRSIQNNPNNDEFWRLRGWTSRPGDWQERIYGN